MQGAGKMSDERQKHQECGTCGYVALEGGCEYVWRREENVGALLTGFHARSCHWSIG